MGMINERRKFKRKVKQDNPTNPTGRINIETSKFNIESDTIKEQQRKK